MALDPKDFSPEKLAELEKKLREIERLSEKLNANINTANLKPLRENAGAIEAIYKRLNDESRELGDNTDYLASSFKDLINQISNSNSGTKELGKNLRTLSSISDQLSQYQKDFSNASSKDIAKLQSKTQIETNRLKITQNILKTERFTLENQINSANFSSRTEAEQRKILSNLNQNIVAQETINNLLQNEDILLGDLNTELEKAFNKAKKIENIYGLSGAAVDGINKALGKLGFNGLASQLGIDEAKSKMSELATKIAEVPEQIASSQERLNLLSRELEAIKDSELAKNQSIYDITSRISSLNTRGLSEKQILHGFGGKELKNLQLQLIQERQILDSLQAKNQAIQANIGEEEKELKILNQFNASHSGILGKLAVMKAGFSSIGASLIKNLKDPIVVIGFLVNQIIDAFQSADKATGNLAKDFNLTYQQAIGVRNELIQIGNLSGDIALNSRALQESMVAVGQSLGSNAMLNQADLETFTKLREKAGLTNEELVSMERLTLATGGNLEDNTEQFLGTVAALRVQNKLAVNEKQLLREVAKVSDAIKLSVGGTNDKLAKAAFQAKQFGINLDQADKIAESLLDFESSITAELEAELLTGKDLNLERARLLALNGDIAGASAEILKQVKGSAEFTKMNRIQQEALAKAVGMSREDLAASLVEREALASIGRNLTDEEKAAYEFAKQKYGVEGAAKMLGEGKLKDMMHQQSVQERFNQTVEKLKEIFVSLVQPILSIADTLMLVTKPIAVIAGGLGWVANWIGKIIGSGPGMIALFSTIGLLLLPKILSGIGAMGRGLMSGVSALKSMVTSSIDLVKNLAKGSISGMFSPKPGERFAELRKKVKARQALPDTSSVGEGGERIGKKGLTAGFKDNMTNIAEGFKAMGQSGVGKGIFNTMLAGPALLTAVPSIPFILFMGKASLNQLIPNFESLALGLNAMGQGSVLKGIGNTLLAGPALLIAVPSIPFLLFMGKTSLPQLIPNFEALALSLDAMSMPGVLKGIGNILLAGPALITATLGIPFILFMGKVGLPQLTPNFTSLALGLQAMAGTFIGSAALAAFGLASIVALPSLIFLGGIALLGAAGAAGLIALGGGLTSLGAVAATGLPFIAVGLIASLGAAMIPFAYALNIASPAIETFGKAIKSAFEGIASMITGALDGLTKLFTSLNNIDVSKLLLIGPALMGIGVGLLALGGGGALGALGNAFANLLGGGPIEILTELAELGQPLSLLAVSTQTISLSIKQLTSSLENLNIGKLESLSSLKPSEFNLLVNVKYKYETFVLPKVESVKVNAIALINKFIVDSTTLPKIDILAKIITEPIILPTINLLAKVITDPIILPKMDILAKIITEPITLPKVEILAKIITEPFILPKVEILAKIITEPIVLPKINDLIVNIKYNVILPILPTAVDDIIASIKYIVEPVVLPTVENITASIRYTVEPFTLPIIEDVIAKIKYIVESPVLPTITDIIASIRYNIEPLALPTINDIVAKVKYIIEPFTLPVVGDIVAKVKYIVESPIPPLIEDAVAKVKYTIEPFTLPTVEDVIAKVKYTIESPVLPIINDVVASIKYIIEPISLPTVEDITAKVKYIIEPFTLPTVIDNINVKVKYIIEPVVLPKIDNIVATIKFIIEQPILPTIENLTASIKYLVEPFTPPQINDVTAKIKYVYEFPSIPSIKDITATIKFIIEPFTLPVVGDIVAKVKYIIESPTLPLIEDAVAKVRYIVESPILPIVEDITAKIKYIIESPVLPTFEDVIAKIRYTVESPVLPTFEDVIAKVRYIVESPVLPTVEDVIAKVRYIIEPISLPTVEDVIAKVRYLVEPFVLPQIDPITVKINYLLDQLIIPEPNNITIPVSYAYEKLNLPNESIPTVQIPVSYSFGKLDFPKNTLTELTQVKTPLDSLSISIQNLNISLKQLSESLTGLDTAKMEILINKTSSPSVFDSIKNAITSLPVIGNIFKSSTPSPASQAVITSSINEENIKNIEIDKGKFSTEKMSVSDIDKMLDELKAIKNEIANSNKKPVVIENKTSIGIDSTQFAKANEKGAYKIM